MKGFAGCSAIEDRYKVISYILPIIIGNNLILYFVVVVVINKVLIYTPLVILAQFEDIQSYTVNTVTIRCVKVKAVVEAWKCLKKEKC